MAITTSMAPSVAINIEDAWTTAPVSHNSPPPQVAKNQMVTVQLEVSESQVLSQGFDPNVIKDKLRKMIFDELIKSNGSIQFTQQSDPLKHQKVFRAYAYVADTQYTDFSKAVQRNKPMTEEQIKSMWAKYRMPSPVSSDLLMMAKIVEEFHGIR